MSSEPAHSFGTRFSYKVAANGLGGLLNFVQAGLVSRALGPMRYGDYYFLSTFFQQVIAFLDMRSSTWLYIQVSARRGRTRVIGFYVLLALGITILTLLLPVLSSLAGAEQWLWPGQNRTSILMVAGLALTIWYADLFAKVCDALGLTVSLEVARVVNRVFFFLVLVLLARLALLDLPAFVGVQALTNAVLMAVLFFFLLRAGTLRDQSLHPARVDAAANFASVGAYSHPIFIYTLMALASNVADRWLLQKFGGSIEQGLFSLALNLGLAFNIIVDALHPLVMREFSIAFADHDRARAADVYRKLIPTSYVLSAFFLCFAAVYADACVRILGGASYRDAAAVFAVVAFFPIVHSYSMLSGSAIYAANETRLLRNIGLFTTPLGLAATFLLLAPSHYGGAQLGAVGLALKMVVVEWIGNNIVLFFVARMLHLSFPRYFAHQIVVVAALTALAWAARAAVSTFLPAGDAWFAQMLVAGALYAAAASVLLLLVPPIAGIDRREAVAMLRGLWASIGRRPH